MQRRVSRWDNTICRIVILQNGEHFGCKDIYENEDEYT